MVTEHPSLRRQKVKIMDLILIGFELLEAFEIAFEVWTFGVLLANSVDRSKKSI